MRGTRAEQLWREDPSPSYNEIAERAGITLLLTSPDDPPGDIYKQAEALWPVVSPAAQEAKPVDQSGKR